MKENSKRLTEEQAASLALSAMSLAIFHAEPVQESSPVEEPVAD